jgi:hypothetical protein
MRKLDLSSISPTNGMPEKAGSLIHIQLAYQEAIAELQKAKIGNSYDPGSVYVLSGCINTGSGSNYVISSGAVFYNGEVFLVDAATFTVAGGQVAEGAIVTSYYVGAEADTVAFTDGNNRSVHQIRKVAYSSALAGSGIGDYVNACFVSYAISAGIGQTVEWSLPSGVVTDWFNVSTGYGLKYPVLDYQLDDAGVTVIGFKNGDADFGTVGATGGAKSETLVAGNIPPLRTENIFAASSGGTVSVAQTAAGSGLTSIAVNAGSPNTPVSTLPPYVVKLKIKRFQ